MHQPQTMIKSSTQATSPSPIKSELFEALAWFGLLAWSLWYFNGLSSDTLFDKNLKDSGHTVVFFVSTYILIRSLKYLPSDGFKNRGIVCGTALLTGFLVGIAIEIIQPAFGRNASFLDVWYDLLGSSAACLFFLARSSRSGLTKRIFLYLSCLVLLALAAILPSYFLWVEKQRDQALPIVFDFEDNWQREFVAPNMGGHIAYVKAPKGWLDNNSLTLQLTMSKGQYPGVRMHHLPANWSLYEALYFELYSKHSEAFRLNIRIHDAHHERTRNSPYEDRFNRRLTVVPGLNRYSIRLDDVKNAPKQREMALNEIHSLILFGVEPQQTLKVYVDNLRLE